MQCKKWLLATSWHVKSHPLSHFFTLPPQRICELVERRAVAWYNQKHGSNFNPLTLGKPKKVYFLFANSCGVVQTHHKSELDDIKPTSHRIAL